jgi:hypothetical protein
MLSSLRVALVFSCALLIGAVLGSAASVSPAHADAALGSGSAAHPASEAAPPPPDPSKRKEGEPCKSSDECQKHHTCTKVGNQSVCKAPPRPSLPPGAVT